MSLNRRTVFDPRFAYFARPVIQGAMWGDITIFRKRETEADAWDPFDLDNPEFSDQVFSYEKIYVGRARVQPNNDWRARQYRVQGELIAEHAMRFQLDLTGNKLRKHRHRVPTPYPLPDTNLKGDAGLIRSDDQVRVDSVFAPYGAPVDSMVQAHMYSVRIVNASSNSWSRVLLCDFSGQQVIEDD